MNKKVYFLLLISSLLLVIYQVNIFEFYPLKGTWNYISQIWAVLVFVILFWSKKEFTGKTWFTRKKQKSHTPSYQLKETISEEDFIAALPKATESEKKGYIKLTELCCSKEIQQKLILFFENLKDFSNDQEGYMTTLNYVIEYSNKHSLFFIMSLDWKQDIETLEWTIQRLLNNNFNITIKLPNALGYGERASVSYDNVFEDYDKPLRENGLQMGFINTESDEYVICIHQCIDKAKVIECVKAIGYAYTEK